MCRFSDAGSTDADSATLSFYATKDGKITVSYQGWDQARLCSTGNSSPWAAGGRGGHVDKRAGMGVAMADCMGAVQGQCDRRAYGSTKFGTRSSRPNQNRGFIRQVAAGGRLIVDKRMRCALLDLLPPCSHACREKVHRRAKRHENAAAVSDTAPPENETEKRATGLPGASCHHAGDAPWKSLLRDS
jgi:hypothetical protein